MERFLLILALDQLSNEVFVEKAQKSSGLAYVSTGVADHG